MGQSPVENLYNQLLGDPYHGAGLLRRAGERVADLTKDDGRPKLVTSSVMGASNREDSEPSEDVGLVMNLAVALIQWRSPHVLLADEVVQGSLVRYLQRNRLSDAQYLLGFERQKQRHVGYIDRVREDVRDLLLGGEIPKMGRCESLELYLREWLADECEHDFKAQVAGRTTVMECPCGARYWFDQRQPDVWEAVR